MQPELFEGLQTTPPVRRFQPALFPHRFFRFRVAYEDLIFSALGLLLVLLAGFCLGVERGKQIAGPVALAQVSSQKKIPSAGVEKRLPVLTTAVGRPKVTVRSSPIVQTSAARVAKSPSIPAKQKRQGGPYVVQLASYLDAKAARREADRLQRQGFDPQVIKQGRFFELRLGGYRSRTEAGIPLNQLRKIYHDGFVKRISTG